MPRAALSQAGPPERLPGRAAAERAAHKRPPRHVGRPEGPTPTRRPAQPTHPFRARPCPWCSTGAVGHFLHGLVSTWARKVGWWMRPSGRAFSDFRLRLSECILAAPTPCPRALHPLNQQCAISDLQCTLPDRSTSGARFTQSGRWRHAQEPGGQNGSGLEGGRGQGRHGGMRP